MIFGGSVIANVQFPTPPVETLIFPVAARRGTRDVSGCRFTREHGVGESVGGESYWRPSDESGHNLGAPDHNRARDFVGWSREGTRMNISPSSPFFPHRGLFAETSAIGQRSSPRLSTPSKTHRAAAPGIRCNDSGSESRSVACWRERSLRPPVTSGPSGVCFVFPSRAQNEQKSRAVNRVEIPTCQGDAVHLLFCTLFFLRPFFAESVFSTQNHMK